MENQLTPASLSQIMQILQDHFLQATGDEAKAAEMIAGIAEMVKEPGNKLVHFDNVLFMVSVFDKNMIEFHAMVGGNLSMEEKIQELDKTFPKLFKFLKLMEVKVAYTYMDRKAEDTFIGLLDKYKFAKEYMTDPDGKELVAFYVEV
jgi:hypothetical protein